MAVRPLLASFSLRLHAIWQRLARFRSRAESICAVVLLLAAMAALAVGCGGGDDSVTPGGPPVTPPGGVTQLAIVSQPIGGLPQAVLTPALQVQLRDATGAAVASPGVPVSVTLQSAPVGGTLLGTLSQNTDSAGVAMFADLRLSVVGGYFLRVSAAGLPSITSQPINIFGNPPPPQMPTHLAFTVQPSTTEAGQPITPAVRVEVRNGAGALVTSSTASISLALEGGTAGATLLGTTTVNATAGVATFPGLSVSMAGTSYRLRATSSGLSDALSANFIVTAPPVLVFGVQPTNIQVGASIAPAVTVRVESASRALITAPPVSVTLTLEGGTAGAQLTGGGTLTTIAGVVEFATLSVDTVGVGYTLRAQATGFADVLSAPFDVLVSPAVPVALRFVNPIADAPVRGYLGPVEVEVLDANGQRVTGQSVDVTISIGNNPGSAMLRAGWTIPTQVGQLAGVTELIESNGPTLSTCPLVGSGPEHPGSLAWDSSSSALYMLRTNATGRGLLRNDLSSGIETVVRAFGSAPPFDVQSGGIAVDASGRLLLGGFNQSPVPIYELSKVDGTAVLLGTVSVAGPQVKWIYDMTTHPQTGHIYAACGLEGQSWAHGWHMNCWLVRFDPVTLSGEVIGTLPFGTYSLAFFPDGRLWAVSDQSGEPASGVAGPIWELDVATAFATVISGIPQSGIYFLSGVPGLLRGTATVSTTTGVAMFPNLMIEVGGSGYTLRASGLGLIGDEAAAFNVTAPSSQLLPSISFTTNFREVDEDVGAVTVVFTLSQPTTHEVRSFLLVEGDAYSGIHHDLPGPTIAPNFFGDVIRDHVRVIHIPPGHTSGQITFNVTNIIGPQPDRWLFFRLLSANGATFGGNVTHAVVIRDK